MNKTKISLILGCMCIVLTYGIAAQIKTTKNAGLTVSTNATENELRNEVLKAKEKYDNLYNELDEMEKTLETERANATQNNSELSELESKIKEANKALGLTEVTGTGVEVTLDDNSTTISTNYLGNLGDLLVHDIDVIRVVNELKNAGAEAISVNEHRIVSISAIECDGNVIKINGEKIGVPFKIKAIGFPEAIVGALDRTGGYLDTLRTQYGIKATITKQETVTIPKYTGVIKFNDTKSR